MICEQSMKNTRECLKSKILFDIIGKLVEMQVRL